MPLWLFSLHSAQEGRRSAFGGKADVEQPAAYQSRFMSTRPKWTWDAALAAAILAAIGIVVAVLLAN
jgi:hypothetical protein